MVGEQMPSNETGDTIGELWTTRPFPHSPIKELHGVLLGNF